MLRRLGLAGVGAVGATSVWLGYAVTRPPPVYPSDKLSLFKSAAAVDTAAAAPSAVTADAASRRRAVVVGGGVVGVCTALALSEKGYEVVVLDSSSGVAEECSAAAAGGMQRMNHIIDKHTWIKTLKNLSPFATDKYFLVSWMRTMTDPHFLRWLVTFSWTSLFMSDAKRKEAEDAMLGFTDYAIDEFLQLLAPEPRHTNAAITDNGALSLCLGEQGLAAAKERMTWPGMTDLERVRVIDRTELLKLEPWIERTLNQESITGAVHQPVASRGNSPWAAGEVAKLCKDRGVEFLFNTKVLGFERQRSGEDERVSAIFSNKGKMELPEGTEVVLAAGSWTPLLCHKLDLFVPIYPLKGYSLLVDVKGVDAALVPQRVVSYKQLYMAKYHDELRVAGLGQFTGWDTSVDPSVAALVEADAKKLLPDLEQRIDDAKVVVGLRPYAADALLFLGRAPGYSNVCLNVGPGFNGWKNALGTGRVLASLLTNDEAKFKFDTRVFDPRGRVARSPLFCKVCTALRPYQ